MASPVTIHSTDEDLIQVDENGRGEKTFTVTNITGGSIRIGLQCQFENTEQKDWARPRGDVERDLGDQGSDRVIVDFTFQEDAAPGKYVFTLLAYSTKAPNLDFTVSEKVFIEVPEPKQEEPKKPFPWWIPITAVVSVLLIGVVLTVVFWPDNQTTVPDVIGQTEEKAKKIIVEAGLVVGSKDTANATEDFPPNTVMKTNPEPEKEVEKGASISFTVAIKASAPSRPSRPSRPIFPHVIIALHKTDDIIWQYKNGQVHFWPMKNGKRTGGINIYKPVGADWHLKGAGDVNGDGTDDIVWQHKNGQVHFWPMKNGKRTGGINIHTRVGADWKLKAVGNIK